MTRQMRMATLGAALLLMLGLGVAAGRGAFAQTATPSAGSSATTSATQYQDFVSKLAANLGVSDATTVDTAIKTTLKQMVDEQLAAGDISANAAAAAKTAIDNGQTGSDLLDIDHVLNGHGQDGRHGGKANDNDADDASNGSGSGNAAASTPAANSTT